MVHTTSFSVMEAVPWVGEFSKVSIDWSFCIFHPVSGCDALRFEIGGVSYVESTEG